jgi:hypothetical protein
MSRRSSRHVTVVLGALSLLLAAGAAASAGTPVWTIQPIPSPAGATGTYLNAVSCPSRSDCVAVGYSQRAGTAFTMADSWNGSAWTIRPTPIPSSANSSSLSGVACPSPTACIAVGWYTDSTGVHALAESWNGTRWSLQHSPTPTGTYKQTSLNAVSCWSPSGCIAVGTTNGTLAESWNGSRWSILPTPTPAGSADVEQYGVSCPSPTTCFAVGGYLAQPVPYTVVGRVLVESWNGSRWSIQPAPSPARNPLYLAGVACASTASCIAVGWGSNDTTGHALAESWNGSHWKIQPLPHSAGETPANLSGVACPSRTACTAVGFSTDSHMLVEAWNGKRWTTPTAPHPDGYLSGVACPAPTACTAVGSLFESRNG